MLLDSSVCDFGWKAPDFTLLDPDGKSFTMSEYLGDKGLLVIFICNHCPYVKRIAKRLSEDTAILMEEGINVFAIMSNNYHLYESDSPEKMKVFAEKFGFKFPYLVDEEQSVGREYNAICTPDFFGFNNKGELQYRGRLDDAKMGDPANRTPELLKAMRLIAETGKGPELQHPSIGCSIKWRN